VQIDGPPEGFVVEREDDAGGAKGLRKKDLATVKPGNSFDPLITGWKPANLRYGKFKKPGKYRLVFQYSTFESDGNRWLGDTRFTDSATALAKRLIYVPLAQLADSVSFVVRE
jgi:hypothetical protein